MERISYDGRTFRSIENSAGGEVGAETIFHYHQSGDIVWAEYEGGDIFRGHLIAICDSHGKLDMRYHHVNSSGELMTGLCRSVPEITPGGRIRLHEKWQWTIGDHSAGVSVLEEL